MTVSPQQNAAGSSDEVVRFASRYGFPLDPFQLRAIRALEAGRSVLVAAPTGAGKTVVGEFACHYALARGGKCFYTTPIKALSNQKFRDLVGRHGQAKVGLLTGDRSINGEAPLVVMTTEVLRNMIYEASTTLRGLRYVVLDEVHYLADRARGAVWEEVIIQLPASVQIIALSATVSNAEEFGAWLRTVREPDGPTPETRPDGEHQVAETWASGSSVEVIIEERRPVPLRHYYYVGDSVFPMFVSTRKGKSGREQRERAAQGLAGIPNPKVLMLERQASQRNRLTRTGRRLESSVRLRYPPRPVVVQELAERGWLPAIIFVFSRSGCEGAVDQLVLAGIRLTSRHEREQIRAMAEESVAGIPEDDLRVLGYDRFLDALEHGVAPHHAGLVPAFKETVEKAFQSGLLKVVAATETLALGINMPAKSVVIERLEKWDGERHVLLTPGEYTQLTGRAGRRGIDPVGQAIVLYQRDIDFRSVAGLVGTRTYPLTSSFAPSYNMVVNLLRRHDLAHAERLLSRSFAQFQADRSVEGTTRRLGELEEGVTGYARHLHCDRGDWGEYWQLRRELDATRRRERREVRVKREGDVSERLTSLVPGEVIWWSNAPRRGLAVVVSTWITDRGTPLARVVTEDRRISRLGPRELDRAPVRVGAIPLPARGTPRQPAYRAEVAARLREIADPDVPRQEAFEPAEESEAVLALRAAVESHPAHVCPERDEHERWQSRYDEITDEAQRLRAQISRRTHSLVRQLRRLIDVLQELRYLDNRPAPNRDGLLLAGIYAETDLIVAECLRRGIFDGLDASELAGLCALFVYEARGEEAAVPSEMPSEALREAVRAALDVAGEIRTREEAAGLRTLRELDPGFVGAAWRWSEGADLDASLGMLELTGGDFVRTMKQVADLAGQIRDIAPPPIRAAARQAVDRLRRGVVEA
ncbi:MAG: DEAD/DEAH box helicase [Nitriliruptorales bacterium]